MATHEDISMEEEPSVSTPKTVEKRKRNDILVDPDTKQEIVDPKRPRMALDENKKVKCLKVLVAIYEKILTAFTCKVSGFEKRDKTNKEQYDKMHTELSREVILASQITSIIFTVHNVNRQKVKGVNTNMQKKILSTEYNVHYRGKDYSILRSEVDTMWIEILKKESMEYKNFSMEDNDNWYGTMGPYLDMFAAFKLRMDELRLGHGTMPITKKDGTHTSFQVSKYGLTGAHHVLLEGSSFPPERRSSIVQSLGPMTSFLCMIRTEGIYRNKYSAAVKRAMAHIPSIDDIIEITKNNKMSFELSTLIGLLAEILLITTSRQATRMCFPLNFLANILRGRSEDTKTKILKYFNTTGSGGWYLYKMCSQLPWIIQGSMTSEIAAQIVYHSIFGTYKEDLSILSQITNVGTWFTREQMGQCFRGLTKGSAVMFKLPIQEYYAKMSCANQTGLLSGVYNQVSCVPCFSGGRVQKFGDDFFEHIEKARVVGSGGKNMQQIINGLTSTLEELHQTLRKNQGRLNMGTAKWRTISSLDLEKPGDEVELILEGSGKMFMGRN